MRFKMTLSSCNSNVVRRRDENMKKFMKKALGEVVTSLVYKERTGTVVWRLLRRLGTRAS